MDVMFLMVQGNMGKFIHVDEYGNIYLLSIYYIKDSNIVFTNFSYLLFSKMVICSSYEKNYLYMGHITSLG